MVLSNFILVLDGLLLISLIAIAAFYALLLRSLKSAPRLQPTASLPNPDLSLALIIPAYNEAGNLRACVEAALTTELPAATHFKIWIADDQSTDDTGKIAQALAEEHANVSALTGPPRPSDEIWRGKNWACAHAVQFAETDYLLFLDADVRLTPGAISAALAEAQTYKTDLLSCAPKIECSCFSEWLVQPIMMSAIAINFDFEAINTSKRLEDAFAAGPFMLFRRTAYETIGGHAAVHDQVVEDVELARQIRAKGLTLRYVLGVDLIDLRMYSSFGALWEGWTKNYYLGTQENLPLTLLSAFAIGMVFVMPWVGLLASLLLSLPQINAIAVAYYPTLSLYGLTAVTLLLYWLLRITGHRRVSVPIRYWWLSAVGGILVIAIALVSVIKTKTGWGWTWRGRPLKAA
ncbi:glycosyltransferase family 2 protein [Pseudanabaena sp. FACHB-2040]|uniref:glycosyltransferase n=1 Tax=Pseudanabaena sp. FACHB-2040 TaxID=2692859 RepID=UPI0016891F25|nr:glycosyltransferase family 2 protein [Pseudanabaena sp. FACHB-2040]MBD2256440.1 glycosyltransferase [Pseudanabaena sp. FACHB-2040]